MAPVSKLQRINQVEERLNEVSTRMENMELRLNRLQENQEHHFETLKKGQEIFFAEMRALLEQAKGGKDDTQSGLGFRTRNGGGGGYEGRGNLEYRKLEMPIFNGDNPDEWIIRSEQYFKFHHMSEFEKFQAAAVAMEGGALRWYRWENWRRPFLSWEDLKVRVLAQYRPMDARNFHEQWLAVTQTTTVAEYRKAFTDRASPLDNVPETIMKEQFINGLEDKIRSELRVLNPRTLGQAMDLAMRIEEKHRITNAQDVGSTDPTFSLFNDNLVTLPYQGLTQFPTQKPSQINYPPNPNYFPHSQWTPLPPHVPTKALNQMLSNSFSHPNVQNPSNPAPALAQSAQSTDNFSGNARRLSEKELQDRKSKGLCFKCDERWRVGHKCKVRELSVMLMEDEESTSVKNLLPWRPHKLPRHHLEDKVVFSGVYCNKPSD